MIQDILSAYAIKYAESTLPESAVIPGGQKEILIPISFTIYLLQTEKRKILVDAGCDTMPGFLMEHFISPAKLLQENGISPKEITDVIITHTHHDHIDAIRHFPEATVYLQKEEYESAKPYLFEDCKKILFEDTITIDDSVQALKIGGHTIGSSVVLFRHDNQDFLICGDECYTGLCYEKNLPTGTSFCPEKSLSFLNTYQPEAYRILFCHDASILPGKYGIEKLF